MDIERALVSRALQDGDIHALTSRGIEGRHFTTTKSGAEVRSVFEWAAEYQRHYTTVPSLQMVQQHFPAWRGEFSSDPLEALCDEFLRDAKRRYFDSAVIELSTVTRDPTTWDRLDEIILEAAREVASIVPYGRVARLAAEIEQRVEQYEHDALTGVKPGFDLGIPILDQELNGVRPGWLITNAGFSGRGKTQLTLHNLLTAFEQDKVALYLSAEMSRQEVMDRLDTMIMHFRHHDLVRRSLPVGEVQRWRDAARIYSKARGELIVVDKLGGSNVDRVYAEIARYKPDIWAFDYVQRMRGMHTSKAKWESLDDITNELKTIAMETESTGIMVSQDNRSSADEGSTMTNMGGSVAVYQAADVYLGMFSDETYEAQRKMRIKCLKNRHGRKIEVDVWWKPETGEHGRLYQETDSFVKQ